MFAVLLGAGCSDDAASSGPTLTASATTPGVVVETSLPATGPDETEASGAASTFVAEVWADNWFSLYVNGVLVGEDSVPITTERSFNAETITFSATYPLTVAMVTKDYKETDSGLEYIGTDRQQMGDGGFIAQITDTSAGRIVAVTGSDWRGLVVHSAPLNTECATSDAPDSECRFEALDEPSGWTEARFDDSSWTKAIAYTAEQVGVKDGYETITWDATAQLIWSADLQVDNTVLWRTTVVV